jgi:hypothetical protein
MIGGATVSGAGATTGGADEGERGCSKTGNGSAGLGDSKIEVIGAGIGACAGVGAGGGGAISATTGGGVGGAAAGGGGAGGGGGGRLAANSCSKYSPVILSSELDGTLAAMPNSLALARTSLLSMPSFFAIS